MLWPPEYRVAAEQLIGRRCVEVDPPTNLIDLVTANQCLAIDGWRDVAKRVEVDHVAGDGIDGIRRQLIAGKWDAASGQVEERRAERREIPDSFLRGGNRGCRRDALFVAEAFIVAEEKRPIRLQWSAERGAKLILVERLDLAREEVACVEHVVPDEVVHAAIEAVAAAASHDAGRRSAGAPIFRGSTLRQDPELGDRIDGNPYGETSVHAVHVLRTVHEIDVLLRTHAVDGVGLTLAQRPSGRRHAGSEWRDARLQQAELREVSAVQRQVDELASRDHTSQRIGRRVDELHAAGDGDDVSHRGQLQLHAEPDGLAHRDRHALLHRGRELRRLHGHAVLPDRQERQSEEPVGAGDGLPGEAGVRLPGSDPCARHDAHRRIDDSPFDRSSRILCGDGVGQEEHDEQYLMLAAARVLWQALLR